MQLPKFKRDITRELKKHLTGKPNFIQVLTGPRQVGKTTAARQVLEELDLEHHYATADLPSPPDVSWIAQEWERARLLEKKGKPLILVLDEIQKVNRWSEVVKRLWDEDRIRGSKLRVVILGSSSLLLQKGLTEGLAGRFELLRCFHWRYEECQACFGWELDAYLYFGGYPSAAPLIEDEFQWGAYVRDSLIETALFKRRAPTESG